jgi:Ankyrin repeat
MLVPNCGVHMVTDTSRSCAGLILKHGINVKMRKGNPFGTLLHEASNAGRVDIVRLLLHHSANVNARGFHNKTSLALCISAGTHPSQGRAYPAEYGADANAKDNTPLTPLRWNTQKASRCSETTVRWGEEKEPR